jgi:hypothetical protein
VSQAQNLYDRTNLVSQSTEVRWFIPGDGPTVQKDLGRTVIDSYYCDLLDDGFSVKVRQIDSPGVFMKIRTAVHPRIAIGDIEGTPETWLRIEPERLIWNTEEDRVEVRKRIVKSKGIEVAYIELGGEVWWSLALRVRGAALPRLPRHIAIHLRHCSEAISCSYPTWLLRKRR